MMDVRTMIAGLDRRKIAGLVGIGIVLVSAAVLFHTASADRRIAGIHGYTIGGNLGYGMAYDARLVNGTEFHYSTYTSDHPLCDGSGVNVSYVDCSEDGRTTTDAGFPGVAAVYRNGTGLMVDDRMLPVGTCLDARTDQVYDCPPSPVQLVGQPVRAVAGSLDW